MVPLHAVLLCNPCVFHPGLPSAVPCLPEIAHFIVGALFAGPHMSGQLIEDDYSLCYLVFATVFPFPDLFLPKILFFSRRTFHHLFEGSLRNARFLVCTYLLSGIVSRRRVPLRRISFFFKQTHVPAPSPLLYPGCLLVQSSGAVPSLLLYVVLMLCLSGEGFPFVLFLLLVGLTPDSSAPSSFPIPWVNRAFCIWVFFSFFCVVEATPQCCVLFVSPSSFLRFFFFSLQVFPGLLPDLVTLIRSVVM